MMTDDFFSPSGFHKPLGWTDFLFLLSAFLLFSIVRKKQTKNLVGYWKSSRLNASINILIAPSVLLLDRDERKPQKIVGRRRNEQKKKKNTRNTITIEREGDNECCTESDRHSLRQLQTISTGNHYCDAAWNSSKAQGSGMRKGVRKKRVFRGMAERVRNTSVRSTTRRRRKKKQKEMRWRDR